MYEELGEEEVPELELTFEVVVLEDGWYEEQEGEEAPEFEAILEIIALEGGWRAVITWLNGWRRGGMCTGSCGVDRELKRENNKRESIDDSAPDCRRA